MTKAKDAGVALAPWRAPRTKRIRILGRNLEDSLMSLSVRPALGASHRTYSSLGVRWRDRPRQLAGFIVDVVALSQLSSSGTLCDICACQ